MTGYDYFLRTHPLREQDKLVVAIKALHMATHGRTASDATVRHILWRLLFERDRFPDLAAATADWHTLAPTLTPTTTLTRAGRVRLEGRVFRDDAGQFFGLGATLFSALWMARYDRGRLQRALDWLHSYGVDHVHVLCGTDRQDRVIDPLGWGLRAFETTLDDLVRDCRSRGIRLQPILLSGGLMIPRDKRLWWAEHMARVLSRYEADVIFVELFLEGQKTVHDCSDDDLSEMATVWLAQSSLLLAPTAPLASGSDGAETVREWQRGWMPFDLASIHTDRSVRSPSGVFRHCRQPWHYRSIGPWANKEPAGAGRGEDDPARLAMEMAISIVSGAASYTWHSAAGVWDDQPLRDIDHAEAQLLALRGVKRLLPPGLPNADRWNAGSGGHPYDDDDPHEAQRVRAYAAGPVDGCSYVAVLGQKDSYEVAARFDMRVDVFDATDAGQGPRETLELREGERHTYRRAGDYIHRVTPR